MDSITRKILAMIVVCTPRVMLRGCTCREGKGERTDRHQRVCKKGEQIPSRLLKREHRVDSSSCVEGESDC